MTTRRLAAFAHAVTTRLLAAFALLLAVAPAAAHEGHGEPGAGEAPGSPRGSAPALYEPPAPGTYALPPLGVVAPQTLRDPQGRPVPLLDEAPGRVHFVSFVYLSCTDACPAATASLQGLDALVAADPRLAGHVELVTVSFDPARDTPEAMGRYARQLSHRGAWRFLTAQDPAAIRPVLAAFGQDATPQLAADGDPTGKLRHVLKVFLVDDARRIRNIYSSGFLDPRLLRNDAISVLDEDASGRP